MRFPLYGWLGLFIMLAAELLLLIGNKLVATWFTPIMWTGYILFVDAIVLRVRGRSRLSSNPREIPFLLLISVGVWLLFEAYNLHLKNWLYLGLPIEPFQRNLGFFWSFSTIMPGVFVTIDLVQISLFRGKVKLNRSNRRNKEKLIGVPLVILGLIMVVLPILLPGEIAAYLFGLIWLGYIFLIEPLNQRLGVRSLLDELRRGKVRNVVVILLAGLLCGFIWESWNFQALNASGAYWVYTIPEALQIFGWKYGMMPVLGLLGFAPFAWELVVMYEFVRRVFGGDKRMGSRSLIH